jgi:predicted anti-sigma-YlaC factor YlaD
VTDPRDRLREGQPERLEQLIDGLVRSQPARRAPAGLEARVLARIAAQPWWRKGFAHWPLWARGAFLVASYGFVRLALAGVMSVIELVSTADVADVDALHRTREAVSTTVSLGEMVLHAIPPVWLYTGAAVGFMLYAVLFGLGTFAYRTLYVQR